MNKKQITGIGIVFLLIAVYLGIQKYASNAAEKKVNEVIAKDGFLIVVNNRKGYFDTNRRKIVGK